MLAIPFSFPTLRARSWLFAALLMTLAAVGLPVFPALAQAQAPAQSGIAAQVKVLVNQWDAASARELLGPWAAANKTALSVIEVDDVDAQAAMRGKIADLIVPFQALPQSRSEAFGFDSLRVGEDRLVLVVHPACVLEELDAPLLEAIVAGRFGSWRDVGGPAAPVMVCRPQQNLDVLTGSGVLISTPGQLRYTISKNLTAMGWLSEAVVDPTVKALGAPGVEGYPRRREVSVLVQKADQGLAASLRAYLDSEAGRVAAYRGGYSAKP